MRKSLKDYKSIVPLTQKTVVLLGMTENWTVEGTREGCLPGKRVTSTCGMENDKGRRCLGINKQTGFSTSSFLLLRGNLPRQSILPAPPCFTRRSGGTFLLLCPNFSISNVCLQQRIPFLSEISGSKLTSELSEHNAFLRGEFFRLSERRESPTEHGGSSCSCLWQTPAKSVIFRFLFLEPGARPHPSGFFGS